ncbi:MAG TPA: Ldh family oxidoreductase [Stellaceae bacterium]|jgi:LDH2 family malate/lactate/ureidoglycolate dehydrogenase|nr:Ldh family oxidoreductase [Stellaceae bacterium]
MEYFDPQSLREVGEALFGGEGLPPEDAAIVVDGMIRANLRGIDSHGLSRVPMYLDRLRKKVVNPRPNIRLEPVMPAVSLVDGDDGMGFLVGRRAMDEACRLAGNVGIGLVGARRSTHYGMAALYVQQAIEAGYIALALTNSSPAIPVWGGRTTFLGAAPLAAGVPAGRHTPYVLDMAMTVIARGKIRLAAQRGEPIPLGLALDLEGKPTQDASKAFEGVCLPFGGVKGAALSMLMDLLAGVLTGANYGGDVKSLYFDHSAPQDVGHLFIAIKPDLFQSRETFDARMDTFVERVKDQPRAFGFDEILMPGEPEERTVAKRSRTGLPITDNVVRDLKAEADKLGLAFPVGSPVPLELT